MPRKAPTDNIALFTSQEKMNALPQCRKRMGVCQVIAFLEAW